MKNDEVSVVTNIIDKKGENQLSEEELFDMAMRKEGKWNIERWRSERTVVGPDQLRIKRNQEPHDGLAELYADGSTASAAGKTWEEGKSKITRTIRPVFDNMKSARLKVNEDKTKLSR